MKRKLLDLYCKAGGCTRGYQMAGFEVTGVDIEPQPKYIGDHFHQADALEFVAAHGHEFDAIAASPPCQRYTSMLNIMPERREKHPDLLLPTIKALDLIGLPYVVENVPGSPIPANIMLCGTMFGLRTPCGAELQRHRYFAAPWWSALVPPCHHGCGPVIGVYGHSPMNQAFYDDRKKVKRRTIGVYGTVAGRDPAIEKARSRDRKRRTITVTGNTPQQNTVRNEVRETFTIDAARIAMGIDWMGMKELSQAIPPAYTKFIGDELMLFLDQRMVA